MTLAFALVRRRDDDLAQATATAELRGVVNRPERRVVAGATVTATDNNKGTTRTVTSDERR